MKQIARLNLPPRLLTGISWGVTFVLVAAMVGVAIWRLSPAPALASEPTPEETGGLAGLPSLTSANNAEPAIVRKVDLVTERDTNLRYGVLEYTVARGDTVSSIAEEFGLKSSSVMWANEELMVNGPNSLSVGQQLLIPPVDGVLYEWEEGDTVELVAEVFQSTPEDILFWPGNDIDLSNPVIAAGAYVMVPGGKSDAIQWISASAGGIGTGTSTGSATICGDGGPVGGGGTLMWPSPYHYINGGNQFSSTHLAIDLYAPEGTEIYAADSGVVVWSSYGEWNGGYGNVVRIDHRNGYSTLYGHLSQVNVGACQAVYAGQVIGLSGNTGNSFGAHLHFEVRQGGGYMNPWDFLPPP